MSEPNPLGCTCPGMGYLAGIQLFPDVHWELWAQGDIGGPEPLATQEDGICDECRSAPSCADRATGIRERLIETGVIPP